MSALPPSMFRTQRVEVDGVHINCAIGDGPPVLMLHGYPQTHPIWHLVAQALALGALARRQRLGALRKRTRQ